MKLKIERVEEEDQIPYPIAQTAFIPMKVPESGILISHGLSPKIYMPFSILQSLISLEKGECKEIDIYDQLKNS